MSSQPSVRVLPPAGSEEQSFGLGTSSSTAQQQPGQDVNAGNGAGGAMIRTTTVTDQSIHVGIETGGTSCKIGICRGVDLKNFLRGGNADVLQQSIVSMHVATDTAEETIRRMCAAIDDLVEWITTGDGTPPPSQPSIPSTTASDNSSGNDNQGSATGSFEKPLLFDSLGILAFGPLCLDKASRQFGSVTSTPKPGWQNTPLLKRVVEGTRKARLAGFAGISCRGGVDVLALARAPNVVFDTDCNLLADFELRYGQGTASASSGTTGAATGDSNIVKNVVDDYLCYITVGTGVGIGAIVNGAPLHGLIHPEGGHMLVPAPAGEEGEEVPETGTCPAHGASCVEGNITNNAIVGRLKLASVEQLASLPDHHPVWARTAHYLAMLCLNLTLICSFKKIVIGGGIVVFRKDVILPLVRKKFAELLGGYLRHERLEAGMPAGTGLDEYIVASRFKTGLGLLAAITAPCGGE